MQDKETTIQELKSLVEQFKQERNWGKHHTAKNLAVSIVLEAAELLEHFQWDDKKEERKEIEQELADVIIYCLFFALAEDIDIAGAVEEKLDHVSRKYPAESFQNKEGRLHEYYKIKQTYRGKT